MSLPNRLKAQELLEQHVTDEYQLYHALMVATAMAGYAEKYKADSDLWYITGLLHDIDYQEHPDTHPAQSLEWFRDWGYPEDLIHAVAAHAYGYNRNTILPETQLAAALMACDEICGIFYAYQKLNPIPFGDMKVSSIKKRLKDQGFAAKINRNDINLGCELFEIDLNDHIENLISYLGQLDK